MVRSGLAEDVGSCVDLDCQSAPRPVGVCRFRFPAEVITVAVRWYSRYGLSYRDVEELLVERALLH